MRIVHTCLRYPPASGGAETYIKQLVERTQDIEAGRDVRVLTSSMRTHGPITSLDPLLLRDDPIYVQRLHHTSTPVVSYPRLQALSYYIGHHKPDILHSYGFWYQPADVTARYAAKHDIPFIFHPIYYENDIRKKRVWQVYKHTIGKKTFEAASVVAVISPFEQKLIEDAGFPVKRFELIPPGIDIQEYEQPKINPFIKKDIKGTILLTVSRIAKGKGLDDIIRALPSIMRNVPDVQLAIVGEDFGAQQALTELAKSYDMQNRIHFLGKVSATELIGCYQHATMLIHPSHYEAFGIVLAESLAAGTPVVARNTSAIPYVAPHDKAGLLFDKNEQLINHVVDLVNHPTKREQIAASGKQRVQDNFNWDSSIKKLVDLYTDIDQNA